MLARIILIVFSLFLFSFVTIRQSGNEKEFRHISINDTKINVEIAKTAADRYAGLSNRSGLCDRCGMLFIFESSEPRTFVMRDMNFALDMIWLNANKVIGFKENLQPEPGPRYTPQQSLAPADMVLEVPAGFVSARDISIGDELIYETYSTK